MRHRRTLPCIGLALAWTTTAGAAVATVPAPPAARSVDRLIADLDAADPAVRDAATTDLRNDWSAAARAAVIAALPGASPEAADRLESVLLWTGPWSTPAAAVVDPGVRLASDDYATLSADDRAARVAALQGDGATAALFRVLRDDPAASVRWAAANALRLRFDDDPPLAAEALAQVAHPPDDRWAYPPVAANAPLLAAAAWACRLADPARSDDLLARALAVEARHPSPAAGQADFAYLWAADRATDRGDYPAAADLFRRLAARTAWSDVEVPEPVEDLFALQAEHGPFPGFADDLRLYRPYLRRPELLYCLARLADRGGGLTGTVGQGVLDAAAVAAGGTAADAHSSAGLFLYRHGWPQAAMRELRLALWLSGPDGVADIDFDLHAVADDCDDDAAAGRYLEDGLRHSPRIMGRVTRYGQTIPWTEADAWATVHWHYLRAAVTAGKRAAALAQARQVLDLDAAGDVLLHDPGMAADVVPVLADAGRRAEADRVFDTAFAALSKQVLAHPAEAMPKNNLAWLCARSDRRLNDADRLSAAAVALTPLDAACLDTRAEVLCRQGHAADAVTLERRALAAKPDDVYMQRQLVRFRAAAKLQGR